MICRTEGFHQNEMKQRSDKIKEEPPYNKAILHVSDPEGARTLDLRRDRPAL